MYGCGVVIDVLDVDILICMLCNISLNLNFGGEVMIVSFGCEKLQFECLLLLGVILVIVIGNGGVVCLQDVVYVGFNLMIDLIMKMVELYFEWFNCCCCEMCFVLDFVVGVQCGGSDVFLGFIVNLVVGFVVDLLVCVGVMIMFLEVIEVCDGVVQFMLCVVNEDVVCEIICEMDWYDCYLQCGCVDCSVNMMLGNKKGGLLNIVEKVMGLIVKLGSVLIVGVVCFGDWVWQKGLLYVVMFVSDFICGMLQFVVGMNLYIFMIGCGMLYGFVQVLVIKVVMCSDFVCCWYDLMDFDVGQIVIGVVMIEDMGWELFWLMFDVVSGKCCMWVE